MWHDQQYQQLIDTIEREDWSRSRTGEFIMYFTQYVGVDDCKVLCKLL